VRWPAALVALAGCLGPQVPDDPAPTHVLPAGSVVPWADDDPEVHERLDDDDGVDGIVTRVSAFEGGAPTAYYDFGAAPDFAAPLFLLVREPEEGTYVPIGQPPVVEAVPGDAGYSPFWVVFYAVVTDRYEDQVLPSIEALQEAEALDLVEAPEPQDHGIDCPVVADGVTLESGESPDGVLYAHGLAYHYFQFSEVPIDGGVHVPDAPRYVLRREGQEPLSEIVRHVDMDGDGDVEDTNDVLEGSSPLCRTVQVAVPAGTGSIDTSGSEAVADVMDAAQLFDPAPTASVVAFETTDEVRHCGVPQ
jgi:hypothetical protein